MKASATGAKPAKKKDLEISSRLFFRIAVGELIAVLVCFAAALYFGVRANVFESKLDRINRVVTILTESQAIEDVPRFVFKGLTDIKTITSETGASQ